MGDGSGRNNLHSERAESDVQQEDRQSFPAARTQPTQVGESLSWCGDGLRDRSFRLVPTRYLRTREKSTPGRSRQTQRGQLGLAGLQQLREVPLQRARCGSTDQAFEQLTVVRDTVHWRNLRPTDERRQPSPLRGRPERRVADNIPAQWEPTSIVPSGSQPSTS